MLVLVEDKRKDQRVSGGIVRVGATVGQSAYLLLFDTLILFGTQITNFSKSRTSYTSRIMSVSDAISVFAEGTFEEQVCCVLFHTVNLDSISHFHQILELVNYLARSLPEEQRPSFVQPFQDALATTEGQTPFEKDEERRRQVLSKVVDEVKDLGDGSERGAHVLPWSYGVGSALRESEIEGFFNLLFAHLLFLFPLGSPQTSAYIVGLLQTISDSNEPSNIKYRMYVYFLVLGFLL